jgi:hypothetical protein
MTIVLGALTVLGCSILVGMAGFGIYASFKWPQAD